VDGFQLILINLKELKLNILIVIIHMKLIGIILINLRKLDLVKLNYYLGILKQIVNMVIFHNQLKNI